MRKKYILLKDSPELKKGAILEADCEGGDQGYTCSDEEFIRAKDQISCHYSEDSVAKNPDWFQEICLVEVPTRQVAKVRKFIKSLN